MRRDRIRPRLFGVFLPACALLLSATPANAQGDRVHLLSRSDRYVQYNDVFGFRTAEGREVAVLGTYDGTSFVETTDPRNPVELKFIARPSSIWSDMAFWQNHVYVVTEAGGGLQIIDVSSLSNIKLVKTYTNAFSSAHSLWIDTTRGHAYICASDVGMPILNLANPTSPTIITNYVGQYVHEATAQNGLAHFSEIYAGLYRLVDVSGLPSIVTLDTASTPAFFTHSTTVNQTDALTGMLDEVVGTSLVLYDITNRSNIVQRGTFLENPDGILHNVWMEDDVAHLSAYAEGYVVVDVTRPDRPLRLGAYDTWSGASGGYNGAWGVYPQPSGTIYISNIEDGLWVLCRATHIGHSGLADTLDEIGPYSVVATITPSAYGGGLSAVKLFFSIDDGATETSAAMAPTGNPQEWSAAIPGMPAGTTVQYRIEAADSLGTSFAPVERDGSFVFSVGRRTRRSFTDFEGSTDGGWTHGASQGTDDWARGKPGRRAGDPYAAFSGTKVFGTDLGTASDGEYEKSVTTFLDSPQINLSNVRGIRLRFQRWLNVEDSSFDQARILVNNVEVWKNPGNGSNLQTRDVEWLTSDLDISDEADDRVSVRVRFELKTNGTNNYGGWNLDDVEIYSVSSCSPPETYGAGTAGSGGFVPVLGTVTDPFIGNTAFRIEGDDLLGGAPGFLLVGFGRAQIPYKSIDILVDLSSPFLFIPVVASGPNGVAGAGSFSITSAIPEDPLLEEIEVDNQVLMFDPGGPQGLAASAGLAFTICH